MKEERMRGVRKAIGRGRQTREGGGEEKKEMVK